MENVVTRSNTANVTWYQQLHKIKLLQRMSYI